MRQYFMRAGRASRVYEVFLGVTHIERKKRPVFSAAVPDSRSEVTSICFKQEACVLPADYESQSAVRRRLAALQRKPLRVHMAVMLGATLAAGIGASKLLLVLGLDDVLWRYPLIVLVSYGVFFAVVKLWLILFAGAKLALFDPTGIVDGLPSGSGGGGGSAGGLGGGTFGGGSFGGGGVSAGFQPVALPVVDPPPADLPLPAPSLTGGGGGGAGSGGGSGSGSGGSLLDGLGSLDDDSGLLLVVIALVALLVAVFGAGALLIWHAPAILGEAAFNTLLAAGLYRRAHAIGRPGWAGSVFRATRWPFAGVLVVSAAAGWVMHRFVPEAHRVADVVRLVLER